MCHLVRLAKVGKPEDAVRSEQCETGRAKTTSTTGSVYSEKSEASHRWNLQPISD